MSVLADVPAMASHILGISGRKRSGKDSLAARLITHHGFTRVAFADPLKAVALDLDPIVPVEPDEVGLLYGPGAMYLAAQHHRLSTIVGDVGWEGAKEFREVRRLLQVLGVAVRDHVDTEAWVEAAMRQADEIPGPVVITDVRFPNEVEAIRGWHHTDDIPTRPKVWSAGKLVRVTRPGLPETGLHVSETALDALVADYPVANDSTIEALHAQADAVARSVLSGS